jgi:hypothetical protein
MMRRAREGKFICMSFQFWSCKNVTTDTKVTTDTYPWSKCAFAVIFGDAVQAIQKQSRNFDQNKPNIVDESSVVWKWRPHPHGTYFSRMSEVTTATKQSMSKITNDPKTTRFGNKLLCGNHSESKLLFCGVAMLNADVFLLKLHGINCIS